MTEQEAIKTTQQTKDERLTKYCPVINQQCREDCVCFFEGNPHKKWGKTAEWAPGDIQCTHVMIEGILTAEVYS
jgi:hypothetical protein